MVHNLRSSFSIIFFLIFSKEVSAAFHNKKHTRFIEFLSNYEVVPIKTKHFSKRILLEGQYPKGQKKNVHPIESDFQFAAFGKKFHAQIQKNFKLFGPNYSEEGQVYEDGVLISSHKREWSHETNNCHYLGEISGEDSSQVAVSTCGGGFSGQFFVGDRLYGIEPAVNFLTLEHLNRIKKTLDSRDSEMLHLVYDTNDANIPAWQCGVTVEDELGHSSHHVHTLSAAETFAPHLKRNDSAHNHEHEHDHSHGYDNSHAHEHKRSLMQTETFVELLAINDKARYDTMGDAVYVKTVALVNLIHANYYRSAILTTTPQIVLVAQIAWIRGNPDPVSDVTIGDLNQCPECTANEVSVSVLLERFDSWRRKVGFQPEHDNCHLFSGWDFSENTLGYAHVAAMCNDGISSGINQVGQGMTTAFDAGIITHEMGHNFGMRHDGQNSGNSCASSGWFMNAIVRGTPFEFSTCSTQYMQDFLGGSALCLDNQPTKKFGDAVCGDGFLDKTEECDCGGTDCSLNTNIGHPDKCCNGTSCTFFPGKKCSATSTCCDPRTCQPLLKHTLCRPADQSGCGVGEFCDGVSGDCPVDLHKGAGVTCSDAVGIRGLCSNGVCMSHLKQCADVGKNLEQSFTGCPTQAQQNGGEFCGQLWCSNSLRQCTYIAQSDQGFIQTQDGIPCGVGQEARQCLEGQCVTSDNLNPNVYWKPTEWSNCPSCDIDQTRSLTCTYSLGTPFSLLDEQCSPINIPPTTQECQNLSLGCVHATNLFDQQSIRIPFLDDNVSRNTFMFVALGILALIFVVLACCYQAVTYGPAMIDIVYDDYEISKSVG